MRFTVIGHACLYLETRAGTLLVDPWLFGSAGWRAWWHYPPIDEIEERWLQPDFIYLTHHHPDHFHYPSLRRIDKRTRVLVPHFGVDVMGAELRNLGFSDVTELRHGEPFALGPDAEVASYQYGFDDTGLVVAADGTVLVDLNDAKLRGRSLHQVVDRYGRPDFMLKGFSWAQSYPYCYTADDPADLELVTRESPMQDFLDTALELKPRFAVPFASYVAFLHPDTRDLNEFGVSPGELREFVDASGGIPGTELVPMLPGDSWDAADGFRCTTEDWWAHREERIAELAVEVAPKLEQQAAAEAAQPLDFRTFADYFTAFASALPFPVRAKAIPRPIVFEVPSAERPYWVVDIVKRRVLAQHVVPSDAADVIRVPEGVLADAIEKRIVHFVHGSMRIRTHLRAGGASADLAFWGLLMVWEIGYLPLRRVANPRFAATLWRRRREAYDAFGMLFGSGTFLERMAKGFTPDTEERAA